LGRPLAAADPTSAQAKRDVSASLIKLGDVLATRGDLDGAHTAFREALEIRRTLAAADPANMQAVLDVGVSYAWLGQCAEAMGNRAEAHAHFLHAKAQFDAVVAIAPDWVQAQGMAQAAADLAARLA
jgi:hypothetical protein